jgi:hypothetical protein
MTNVESTSVKNAGTVSEPAQRWSELLAQVRADALANDYANKKPK